MRFALIASLFLAASNAFGQAKDLVGATYRDFSGGLADNIDASAMAPNQSPALQNVLIDDPVGSLRPRKGYVQCGTTPSGSEATALFEYSKSDGSRKLIVSDNTSVWETPDCINYSTVTTGLNSTSRPSFSIVRDKLWTVNGTTWPFTWDGTTKVSLDGTGSSPNPGPPNCRYIEFWKERVWCARSGTNPSLVAYSAITGTLGDDLDPSTGTAAWPATNAFYIDREGGSPIYGLKAFRDRLYVFKNNGIWEILFDNDFDNAIKKTYSSVGSRFNTAIKEIDGVLYFAGPDGIYAFDGDRSVRISELVNNTYKSASQLLSNELFKIWDTNSDFSAGTSSRTTVTGSAVFLTQDPERIQNPGFETGDFTSWTTTRTLGGTDHGDGHADIVSGTANTYAARVYADCDDFSTGNGSSALYVYDNTGSTRTTVTSFSRTYSTTTVDTSSYRGEIIQLHFLAIANSSATSAEMWSSTFTAGNSFSFAATAWACDPDKKVGWQDLDNFSGFAYLSSGTHTSDIFNAVTVSTWSTFDATAVNNGGSISYSYRTGTSNAAVLAASWNSITPGSVINSSVDRTRIQWKADFVASSDLSQSPELQEVSVSYFQGGDASKAIYLGSSDNRLWVSISTGGASDNNIVLVKSKSPLNSWSLYNIPLGPMVRYNDLFYAASSTSSQIYRMEYGLNDAGVPIEWYWQSRDELWGQPSNMKQLLEMTLDFRNEDACAINVGYSTTGGVHFCVAEPVSANLSGFGSKRLFVEGGQGYAYRFQICSDALDQAATITGITGWARIMRSRGN